MITKRIIPCLDVRNGRVVKGTNFEGIRDVADPVEMARMYNAAGADELVFYDIHRQLRGPGAVYGYPDPRRQRNFYPAHGGRRHQHAGRF